MERNWAGNLAYRAERIVHPTTTDELVTRSATTARCVRSAPGTRSTTSPTPRARWIETDGCPSTSTRRRAGRSARLGGIRYGELAAVLHERRAGRSRTSRRCRTSRWPARSRPARTDRATPPARSRAPCAASSSSPPTASRSCSSAATPTSTGAVVNLGALGVVTALELDIEPTYDVAQSVFEGPAWDAVLADLDAVTSLGTSVSLFTTWSRPDVARPAVGEAAAAATRMPRRDAVPPLKPSARARRRQARHPLPGLAADACTEQLGVPGPWFERLPHFRLEFTPVERATSCSRSSSCRGRDAVAAIEAVRGLADRIAPLLQVCEMRTVRRRRPLAVRRVRRDTVGIHFTWRRDQPAVEALLPGSRRRCPRRRGRTGASSSPARRRGAASIPPVAGLRRAPGRLDPNGLFRNPYLERFGLRARAIRPSGIPLECRKT